jgi:hypothetical protein
MNQEQVKEVLLSLEEAPLEFTLIFSGKQSKKVNGLYKCETREIVIHNRNFQGEAGDDNLLLYTAIHEYAHHLHACSRGGRLSNRAHTTEFWAIFHGLLEKAERQGIYKNVFDRSPELSSLTALIRKRYLYENGSLVKDLGKELRRAHELCLSVGGRFEDYLDRVLRIPRTAANLAMKMYLYDLDPAVGADNMRFLAGIPNEERRTAAEASLKAGKSPDTVKIAARRPPPEEDERERLEREKLRLERTIAALSKRLKEVEEAREGE